MTQRRGERGMVVVMALGVVLFLGTIGSTLLVRGTHESQLGRRSLGRQQAFFLAEAGIDQSLQNLRTPTDVTDDVNTAALLTGVFTIDTMTPAGGSQWQVTATGTSRQEQRRMEAIVGLTPESLFQFAIFGDQQVAVSGNAYTDSYDSRLGPYDPDANAHNGDVGTNISTAGGIELSGGSLYVDGQLAVGPNAVDPQTVVTDFNPALVSGGTDPPSDTQDVVAQTRTFPMPVVSVPVGLTCLDRMINSNETVTLAPGTYCFHDLTIQGGATLTTSGSVTLYITGELNARGDSTMGVPSDPRQMVVLMPSSGEVTLEQGTLTGSTGFYGALYAPDSTITISGNAEIFGSVIAQRVSVTGSALIHYDEALTDVTQLSNLYRTALVSWRELDN